MTKVKIKKNDQVLVIGGKDRGAKGKVLRVYPTDGTAIVERINMIKRHTRPNPSKQVQGGVLEREAPIRLSNLMVVCPDCDRPVRLGRRRLDDGSGARVCKHCGATLS
jgi:large subunit ribosomal protein L24